MTKGERMKEIAKASPDFGKRVGYEMCVVDEFHDMKELLEENAELKEQNLKDCENFNKTMKEVKEQWNKEHYQLTKAKEIIKRLIKSTYGEGWNYSLQVKVEAEKFLKESE